jgi:YVTN family beta-propeller protein
MQAIRTWYWRAIGAALAAAALHPVQAAEAGYRVADKRVLAGPVRWDYLALDAMRHHLFLTRGDQVDVYDLQQQRVVGSIPATAGVHGVAVAADLGRGYTSNGAANTVTVFDLLTLAPLATVSVGTGPDALVYDAATGRLFVANGDGASLSVIDAATNKLVATIALGGAPETAVVDGKGRLFVALEDKAAIAEVDTRTMQLVARHSVAPACAEPAGLAIDTQAGRLFAGCHNQKMVVLDARTGKVVGAAPIGRGNDAIVFDPQRQLAFASNGDGTLTVVDGAAPFAVRASVATMPRARTMALDPHTHKLYLVAAQVDPAGAPVAKRRPALKAGTFTLITVVPD